jgi:hypothetical protein
MHFQLLATIFDREWEPSCSAKLAGLFSCSIRLLRSRASGRRLMEARFGFVQDHRRRRAWRQQRRNQEEAAGVPSDSSAAFNERSRP